MKSFGILRNQSEQILHNTDKYEMLIKKVRKEKKITRHPK